MGRNIAENVGGRVVESAVRRGVGDYLYKLLYVHIHVASVVKGGPGP